MLESCAWFYTEPPDVLAGVLEKLVTDIRRVLVHPDLGNCDKVLAMFVIVDSVAPPPPPEGDQGTARADNRARTAVTPGRPLAVTQPA